MALSGNDYVDGGAGNDLLQTAAPVPVIPPSLSVDSITLAAEGNTGSTLVTFTVTLSRVSTTTVTVAYATADGPAVLGSDYATTNGTLMFTPGQTTATFTVAVNGDVAIEGNEFFLVNLTNATGGATIGVPQGYCLITDDDPLRLFAVQGGVSMIQEIDPNTGAVLNSFPTPVPNVSGPAGLAYDGVSVFFLVGNSQVYELDPTTGATISIHNIAGISSPVDAIATLNGNVYLMVYRNVNDIVVANLTTNTITSTLDIDALNPGSGIIGGLGALSGGGPDRLIATDFNTAQVHLIDPATGQITSSFTPSTGRGGSYLGAAGINGEIYLGSTSGFIDVFSRTGTLVRTLSVPGASFAALGGDGIVNNATPPLPPVIPPAPTPTTPQEDTIFGSDGNDTVLAGPTNDSLNGGIGDDVIDGGDGDDSVNGGVGNDTLAGGNGSDSYVWDLTNPGADVLADTLGSQTLIVQGNTTGETFNVSQIGTLLKVTKGGNSITTNSTISNVIINAGRGDDTINVTTLNSVQPLILTVNGDDGDDIINATGAVLGSVRFTANGGLGNDTLSGSSSAEALNGDAGDDVLSGDSGNDSLNGGDGLDTVTGGSGNDVISGGTGNDSLLGGLGNDSMSGDDGLDYVDGQEDNDVASGGEGDDTVVGGLGSDIGRGDNGNDLVFGGSGNDSLDGGFGNEVVRGHAGDDQIKGGHGDDTIQGNQGIDIIDGGDGNDSIDGGFGFDNAINNPTLIGNIINGGDGNDTILGGEYNDTLIGGDGTDVITGAAGNDYLYGGDGDDLLHGSGGRDFFNGGQGANSFDLASTPYVETNDLNLTISAAVQLALARLNGF